ncbi:MAG: serine hydrolase domain-containing protein [Congregibacter sp.]
MSAQAMEALYLERYAALTDRSSKNGLASYEPLKTVSGADDWQPLSVRDVAARRLNASTLLAMRNYAELNRSSSLLVWIDGALEAEFYFGDTTRDSLLVSKSLSKPLAAIAVGRAMQRGFIDSLDQSAADFIEAWRGTTKSAITLRQLLGNRSGLLPQGQMSGPEDVLSRAYMHPAHDQVIINDYPLVDEPGTRYEYSNANSELIAPLIESATGVPYEEWVANEVFKPLGARGGEIWMNRPQGTPHSGCCILLPAETFMRLGLLLLNDGVWEGLRLLPDGYVAQMRTVSPQNPHAGLGVYVGSPYIERRGAANPDMDLGENLHSEPYAAEDLFLFDGNSNQVVYMVPSQGVVVLRTGAWAPRDPEWDNALLPNLLLRDLQNQRASRDQSI